MNTIEQAKKLSNTLKMHPTVGLEADAAGTIDALITAINDERLRCAQADNAVEQMALEVLAALKAQDPIATLYIDSYGKVKLGQTMPPEEGAFSVYLAAGAQPVQELLDEVAAQRKVLEMALVALEECSIYAYSGGEGVTASQHREAITAIQEQLA